MLDNLGNNTKERTPCVAKPSIWKIILGIIFFPITLTIIIAKNKKIKPVVKIALIVILWIFVLVVGASNYDEKPNNDNNILDSTYEEKVDNGVPTSDSEQLVTPKLEEIVVVKYHNNEYINKLLTDYNAIAEYPITPEMVQKGAYNSTANVSCNGVWIRISATSNNGIFVDYDDEAANDETIQPIFRDFCKALNSEITDDDVDSVWEILQTEKYQNYNAYNFEGVECTYAESLLVNGEHRYILKTNYKSYGE